MTDQQRLDILHTVDTEFLTTYIPGYWKPHLEEKIARIHALQVQAGVTGTSFGLLADFHCATNCMHSPALMERVLNECGIPYFFNAGDIISGMGIISREDLIQEIVVIQRMFSRIADRQLLAIGNHEFAFSTFPAPDYYAENLTRDEIHEYMFRPQTVYSNRVFGESASYYYVDDTFHKVRYIVLSAHEIPGDELKPDGRPVYHAFRLIGFRQEQLNWFANVALQVPGEDWTVVLCSHESVGLDSSGLVYYNQDLVLGIINAFRKHTTFEGSNCYEDADGHYNATIAVDFTGAGGDFAAWVGGHTHWDTSCMLDGVLAIATLNDSMHNGTRSPFVHEERTLTEQAFDIFTINKKEHKLYATRIGCGEDREFTYDVF